MTVTKGEWSVSFNGERDGYARYSVVTDTQLVASLAVRENEQEVEANANLIVTAVNACKRINPDNPQAVAGAIPEVVEALRAFNHVCEVFNHALLAQRNCKGGATDYYIVNQLDGLLDEAGGLTDKALAKLEKK